MAWGPLINGHRYLCSNHNDSNIQLWVILCVAGLRLGQCRSYNCLNEKCVRVCVSKAQMELMSWPAYLTGEVPCVFAWLSSCLRGQEVLPFPYLPGICERTKLIVLVNSKDLFSLELVHV